ncbi:MAG TPA: hypothetical protein ENK28_00170 [Aliiroseovarius sp.]|nr:hypothetical protein [Aliiroseovarius sp.]
MGLETGKDLDIVSKNGDVVFQSARLQAGNNITVDAQNGAIHFLSEKATEFKQTKTYNIFRSLSGLSALCAS